MIVILIMVTLSLVISLLAYVGGIDLKVCVELNFIVLMSIIILDFYSRRRVNLILFWLFGYIYIIWSEMIYIVNKDAFYADYSSSIGFLLIANALFLIGYYFLNFKINSFVLKRNFCLNFHGVSVRNITTLLLFIYGVFVFFGAFDFFTAFGGGRDLSNALGSGSLIGFLYSSLGLVLPALLVFHFKNVDKRGALFAVFLAIPIFMIILATGTRFRLLFSLVPFLMALGILKLNWRGVPMRKMVLLMCLFCSVAFLGNVIKENRKLPFNEWVFISEGEERKDFFYSMSDFMSPEGCVQMIKLQDYYFDEHPHRYGTQSLFLLYWWVPRSLWAEKPTPIDHWLIREYFDVGDKHSTASSFIGELKADFGNFSLLFMLIIGAWIRALDRWIERKTLDEKSEHIQLIIGFLFPYVFFCVRSPLTSTIALIGSFLIIIIYKMLLHKKS